VRQFYGGARADGEETPVRGRGSGRGGRRGGRGGPPWRHGAPCEVDGVGEQVEEATTDEVLVEEDDGGEVPSYGFASRCCGQALGGWHGAEHCATWLNEGGDKAKWVMAASVTPGEVVSGPSHEGRRRPTATGIERSPCGEWGHQEYRRHARLTDRPVRSNRNVPLTCWAVLLNDFQTPLKHVN
jgi:hypothetical protein